MNNLGSKIRNRDIKCLIEWQTHKIICLYCVKHSKINRYIFVPRIKNIFHSFDKMSLCQHSHDCMKCLFLFMDNKNVNWDEYLSHINSIN